MLGDVDGIAEHGELHAARIADVAERDLAIVQPDADPDRRLAPGAPLVVPGRDRGEHGLAAGDRIARVGLSGARRAEGRHQRIADVFLQRAVVREHGIGHAPVKRAQKRDHLGRLQRSHSRVKPTMSANRTAIACWRTAPIGSAERASCSARCGEK